MDGLTPILEKNDMICQSRLSATKEFDNVAVSTG